MLFRALCCRGQRAMAHASLTTGQAYQWTNGTDLRVKALPYVGFKAFPRFEPQSTQRAQRKTKALLSALCVLCGSNSNLSTCINPDLYGFF